MSSTLRPRRALAAIVLAAPMAAALTATAPAHASTTTWTVVNPNGNGAFSAVSGQLTVKNKSGATVFTCPSLSSTGSLPAGTRTTSGLGAIKSTNPVTCTSPDGTSWQGMFTAAAGPSNLTATSYSAATGTTSITNGDQFNSINLVFRTAVGYSCAFWTHHTAMTYTNATSTLKATTAVVKLATDDGGATLCQGLFTQGETITFATEYKLTPAIKITATVS
ncbi:hypothetical protein [Nocardia canadensis]|uniref:hypothetical protein n=1 Tax=Nocardia canadensis TaxID=3065238 RepID=UPI002931F0F0|nr:hypothetical protein [Nocardia canadensis]